MEIKIHFKAQSEITKEKSKPKEIKKISDLRSILKDENPRFSYGGVEFGSVPSEQDTEEVGETTPNDETKEPKLKNYSTKGRNEGFQGNTPDDKASKEHPETRTKNSKYPTIVGKKMG